MEPVHWNGVRLVPNPHPLYRYKAVCLSVYDADTCTFLIDLGFSVHIKEKCRFIGIDTPEIRTRDNDEKKAGLAARDFVKDRIEGKCVEVETAKKGKFGRYLVTVYYGPGSIELNRQLISMGHAVAYDGGKRRKWKDW
jgi:micrococcal nuclease